MANQHNGSRSPVRAINTATQRAWAPKTAQPRTWSVPKVHEFGSVSPASLPAATPTLACPDCGADLRIALVHAHDSDAVNPPAAAPDLHSAWVPGDLPDFEDSVSAYKRELINRALDDNGGVMTKAAKALGLKYTTFVAMVHRLGIGEEEPQYQPVPQPPTRS